MQFRRITDALPEERERVVRVLAEIELIDAILQRNAVLVCVSPNDEAHVAFVGWVMVASHEDSVRQLVERNLTASGVDAGAVVWVCNAHLAWDWL